MNNLQDLVEAFPSLFRGKRPRVASTLPPGWYELVFELCRDIDSIVRAEPERFSITQIKEKFGGLRFYFSIDGAEDIYADLRTPTGVRTIVQESVGPIMMDRVRAVAQAAMRRSTSICQECGRPGSRSVHRGWAATLCDEHTGQRNREGGDAARRP